MDARSPDGGIDSNTVRLDIDEAKGLEDMNYFGLSVELDVWETDMDTDGETLIVGMGVLGY